MLICDWFRRHYSVCNHANIYVSHTSSSIPMRTNKLHPHHKKYETKKPKLLPSAKTCRPKTPLKSQSELLDALTAKRVRLGRAAASITDSPRGSAASPLRFANWARSRRNRARVELRGRAPFCAAIIQCRFLSRGCGTAEAPMKSSRARSPRLIYRRSPAPSAELGSAMRM